MFHTLSIRFVRRLAPAVAAAAALLAQPACTNNTADDAGQAAEPSPVLDLGYTLRWIAPTDFNASRQPRAFLPMPGGDVAYVDPDNLLSLVDRETGRTRWQASLGSPLLRFAGLGYSDNAIVAATVTNMQAYSLAAGELLERHELPISATSPPIVGSGLAVMGSGSGRVMAVDLDYGFRAWAYDLKGPVSAQPVVVGDSVGFVSRDGQVALLAMRDGASRGRRLDMYAGVTTTPVTDGVNLFVASLDQSIYALSGRPDIGQLWRIRTGFPIRSQPAVDEERLLIHLPERGFTAFSTITGEELWRLENLKGTAIARFGNLLAVNEGSTIHLVNPREGRLVRSVTIPGMRSVYTDGFVDPDLYLLMNDGSIERYTPNR